MKHLAKVSDSRPSVIGTGLVALDVVLSSGGSEPARQWTGGTCGNVLIALQYLGWHSAPVARFKNGEATKRLVEDLRRWNVSTQFITVDDKGSTPVIVHRIGRTSSGEPYHKFCWRCPGCGTRFPGYKPVLSSTVVAMVSKIGTPSVFFFDRVSRGALLLAQECAAQGAAVVFEPTGIGDPKLFREAWAIAHVTKYSHERLQELPADIEKVKGERLQIETLGREGLRYRSLLPRCKTKSWQYLEAISAPELKDAAGAGDWCSAGLIHKLLANGTSGLSRVNDGTVRQAIRYGQAVAAWNCGFEGARGAMYAVDPGTFADEVDRILAGKVKGTPHLPDARSSVEWKAYPCPACGRSESSMCETHPPRGQGVSRRSQQVRCRSPR